MEQKYDWINLLVAVAVSAMVTAVITSTVCYRQSESKRIDLQKAERIFAERDINNVYVECLNSPEIFEGVRVLRESESLTDGLAVDLLKLRLER